MNYDGLIDRKVLDNLLKSVGGDGEFLTELLETYFVDTPHLFTTMHNALSNEDPEEFLRAAHSLKSNSANFGAMGLSQKAKALEEMGKNGNINQAGDSLVEAEAEFIKVRTALETIHKNG